MKDVVFRTLAHSVMRARHKAKKKRPVLVTLVLAPAGLMLLSSCGSTSIKPEVGQIAFTDVSGAPRTAPVSFTAGKPVYLEVAMMNDPQLLGADWTVDCSDALPPGTPLPPGQVVDISCGYFTPVHTLGTPIPPLIPNISAYLTVYTPPATPPQKGTVTLYVSATADHSRFSTLTLQVTP